MNDCTLLMIPQASPKIHPGRVKLGKHAFVSAGWRTFNQTEKEMT